MCDPVTATVAVLGTVAANEMVVKPMKEQQKQAQQAMQQQQQQYEQALQAERETRETVRPEDLNYLAAKESPAQEQRTEMAVQEARDRERRRRYAASGRQSTILTGPLGTSDNATTTSAALSGGVGSNSKSMLGA